MATQNRYKLVIDIDGLTKYKLDNLADFMSAVFAADRTNNLTDELIASMLASIGYEVKVEQGGES